MKDELERINALVKLLELEFVKSIEKIKSRLKIQIDDYLNLKKEAEVRQEYAMKCLNEFEEAIRSKRKKQALYQKTENVKNQKA